MPSRRCRATAAPPPKPQSSWVNWLDSKEQSAAAHQYTYRPPAPVSGNSSSRNLAAAEADDAQEVERPYQYQYLPQARLAASSAPVPPRARLAAAESDRGHEAENPCQYQYLPPPRLAAAESEREQYTYRPPAPSRSSNHRNLPAAEPAADEYHDEHRAVQEVEYEHQIRKLVEPELAMEAERQQDHQHDRATQLAASGIAESDYYQAQQLLVQNAELSAELSDAYAELDARGRESAVLREELERWRACGLGQDVQLGADSGGGGELEAPLCAAELTAAQLSAELAGVEAEAARQAARSEALASAKKKLENRNHRLKHQLQQMRCGSRPKHQSNQCRTCSCACV